MFQLMDLEVAESIQLRLNVLRDLKRLKDDYNLNITNSFIQLGNYADTWYDGIEQALEDICYTIGGEGTTFDSHDADESDADECWYGVHYDPDEFPIGVREIFIPIIKEYQEILYKHNICRIADVKLNHLVSYILNDIGLCNCYEYEPIAFLSKTSPIIKILLGFDYLDYNDFPDNLLKVVNYCKKQVEKYNNDEFIEVKEIKQTSIEEGYRKNKCVIFHYLNKKFERNIV